MAQVIDASERHDDEFLAAFDAFAQAVRRARGAPAQGERGALTLSQYGLLLPLMTESGVRVRDLAERAGIAASTATRILDALERRDLVRRVRDLHDRRSVAVSMTESGWRRLLAQDAWYRGRQQAFFAHLPLQEQELAADLLLRLAGLIDELAAGPAPDGEA